MKKVCVLSYFGMGDCIRFSPIFKGLEEMVGSCEFHFTSPTVALENVFNAKMIQILPISFSKHYDIVLNFVSSLQPDEKDKEIWRGFFKSEDSFSVTHGKIDDIYKEFVGKFNKLDRNSQEVVNLCKQYSPLLSGSTVERFAKFMGIQPSSFEYLYKTTNEECNQIKHLLSTTKKNICLVPKASAKVRCLTKEKSEKIYDLIKYENVIVLGSESQCEDIKELGCKNFFGNIRLSGALIKESDFVITVDSYYSHVSFALGVPAIVLYSYAPNFTMPPEKKGKIIPLEHPTGDCNSIPIDSIKQAVKSI